MQMLDAPTTVIPKEAAAAPADAGATPEPESSAVAAPAAAAPPRPPSTPLAVTDRLAFVLGAANLALTAFWVGRWPSHYHHFWLVKDSVLFVLRWWWYRRMAQHFMLLEYCYVANLAALAHIYFCPSNAFMRRVRRPMGSPPHVLPHPLHPKQFTNPDRFSPPLSDLTPSVLPYQHSSTINTPRPPPRCRCRPRRRLLLLCRVR